MVQVLAGNLWYKQSPKRITQGMGQGSLAAGFRTGQDDDFADGTAPIKLSVQLRTDIVVTIVTVGFIPMQLQRPADCPRIHWPWQ